MSAASNPHDMRRYRAEFLRRAEEDLLDLYEAIAAEAGLQVAGTYVDRIEAACLTLQLSPMKGRDRGDLLPGLRTVGFERRATIVFRVRRSRVTIVRVLYGGRDVERVLRSL